MQANASCFPQQLRQLGDIRHVGHKNGFGFWVRYTAGAFGFLTFSQCGDRPKR
jgi:hypothetical protein